jgi:hypothetical protein
MRRKKKGPMQKQATCIVWYQKRTWVESTHPRRMRIEKKGSMQKQAACIVLPKRTLVGPVGDLSSEEVPMLIYI